MLIGRSSATSAFYLRYCLVDVGALFLPAVPGKDGREGILGLVSGSLLLVYCRLSLIASASAR